MSRHAGKKNYATWNVSLSLDNNKAIHDLAVQYIAQNPNPTYKGFIKWAGLEDKCTEDNISFSDSQLDYEELNGILKEI